MVKASLSKAHTIQGPDLWTGSEEGTYWEGGRSVALGQDPWSPSWEVTLPSHSGERLCALVGRMS